MTIKNALYELLQNVLTDEIVGRFNDWVEQSDDTPEVIKKQIDAATAKLTRNELAVIVAASIHMTKEAAEKRAEAEAAQE